MHAKVLQVLGEPTRLRILDVLRSGEHALNDIVTQTDIHQSGVSRNLRILHRSGFVDVRAFRQQRLYSLR